MMCLVREVIGLPQCWI
ncbi:hypothetical protein M8C21_009374 [Ambrosia artemisiifolia]|uniref:Uncharacterized protein n=1 Tax=Ambrosia artemisiifolia TaxID=4212 RepID=A0AAD5CQ02_AMBAR|nr:hypothetical protein M8C21_009374 [Ambrosia artemisiifolia]